MRDGEFVHKYKKNVERKIEKKNYFKLQVKYCETGVDMNKIHLNASILQLQHFYSFSKKK